MNISVGAEMGRPHRPCTKFDRRPRCRSSCLRHHPRVRAIDGHWLNTIDETVCTMVLGFFVPFLMMTVRDIDEASLELDMFRAMIHV